MRNERFREIIKNINEFMGAAIFGVGAVRAIFLTMAFIQMGTIVVSIFSGSNSGSNLGANEYGMVFMWIAIAEMLLSGISLMMCILNIGYKPIISVGYLMMIIVILMELTLPNIFFCYIECGMCMKAGSMIRKKNIEKNKYYI